MLPEQKARLKIDELLLQSDWAIQDFKQVNLGAKLGIAVREFPLEEGFADYLLFVNKKSIGVIEAKAEGTTLSGVAEQSEKYRTGKLRYIANQKEPLRFAYESTGVETFFRDASDPDPRSRRVFTFHTPETLLEYFSSPVTLRKLLTELPPLLFRFSGLLNKFLLGYFFQSQDYRDTISKLSSGVNINNLRREHLEQLQLFFPPLSEQHHIVSKIEELFTKLDVAINELKTARAQIKRYRQSVLKSAFEGKLTEKWRSERREVRNETAEELLAKIKEERKKTLGNKYKELPPVDTTNLQPLPEGWMWTCLGDIITVSSGNGLTSSNMKSDERYAVYGGNGISGYYDKYMFEKQKLIIGRVGAKCGVVHITEPNSWITDNALIVEFKNLDMKFMFYLIHVLNLNQHSVSTAQPVISGAKIYPIINPLPPFNEQQQIVSEIERHFSVADATEKIIDQSLKQAERLRQSILKDAFTGKLVPQDPNDEPAAKLLERIKEEKQKEAEQKALVKTNIKKRKKSK